MIQLNIIYIYIFTNVVNTALFFDVLFISSFNVASKGASKLHAEDPWI